MSSRHWLWYVWPGLPQLLQGSWWGLGWAIFAGGLLNFALLSTFVWKEWLPGSANTALWGGIVLIWGGAILASIPLKSGYLPSQNVPSSPTDPLFSEAIEFYLQGQWFEAEKRLVHLLRQNPRDVEARLFIATLFRHTRRWDEALRQLDQLERLEASRAWALEIHREREWIQQAKQQEAARSEPSGGAKPEEDGAIPTLEGTVSISPEAA